jgi:hypothetical protein
MSKELTEITYDKLYRFENPRGYENCVTKLTFRVIKRTPCGARIKLYEWETTTKFVRLNCRKQWACNTEAEALTSFLRRKRCEMEYNRQRMDRAEAAIRYAEVHFSRNQTADDPVQRVWKTVSLDVFR